MEGFIISEVKKHPSGVFMPIDRSFKILFTPYYVIGPIFIEQHCSLSVLVSFCRCFFLLTYRFTTQNLFVFVFLYKGNC